MPIWATKFTKTSVTILGATTPRLIDSAWRAARPLGTLDEIVMRAQGSPAETLISTSHWPPASCYLDLHHGSKTRDMLVFPPAGRMTSVLLRCQDLEECISIWGRSECPRSE